MSLQVGDQVRTNKNYAKDYGENIGGIIVGFKILPSIGYEGERETVVIRDFKGLKHEIHESWLIKMEGERDDKYRSGTGYGLSDMDI